MDNGRLGVVESRFAEIIWANEPLTSRQLAELCQEQLGWKRPTTYTVLRKLCQRGIFQNQNGVVSAVLSRQAFYGMQGEKLVEEAFGGSLPAFIAAFTQRRALRPEEIAEIRKMIDNAREE